MNYENEETNPEFEKWLRDQRLLRAIKRMIEDPNLHSVTHAKCPVCNGCGELAVILGAKDDES